MIDCDRGADSFGATRAIVSSAIPPVAPAGRDRRRARSLLGEPPPPRMPARNCCTNVANGLLDIVVESHLVVTHLIHPLPLKTSPKQPHIINEAKSKGGPHG